MMLFIVINVINGIINCMLNADTKVSTIAVCAGSGASVLSDSKADVFITGEMSHHEVLDAMHKGLSVITLYELIN